MPDAKAPLIEAADLLMDISHRLKFGKKIETPHSDFERLAIELRRLGNHAEETSPCIFCGKPSALDSVTDSNGEVACRECGDAELAAQSAEALRP